MHPLFICLALGQKGIGQPLAMQMSVCHRYPVIMLYLCLMPFRRKSSGGWLVSCSLTVHWLHRPGRLLEARVMKVDIVSCLGAKAHGFVLQLRQGVGLRGIPFPQSRASDFGPSLLYPASEPVPHPDGRNSRPRPSVLHPASEPVLHPDGRNSWPYPASRLLPCAVFLLFPHPFIPNDAVRCIGHRSALH